MIRLYNNTAEEILVTLVYLKERVFGRQGSFNLLTNYAAETANRALRDGGSGGDNRVVDAMVRILDKNPMNEQVDDVINQIVSQLEADKDPFKSSDKDLVDTIVRTLQLTFVKNRLSNDMLQRLRTAILLPSELAGVRQRIKNEMICTGCSHKFLHGEMCSIVGEGGDIGSKLLCTNCYSPEFLACAHGKHSVETGKGIRKYLGKSNDCEYCKAEKAGTAVNTGVDENIRVVEDIGGHISIPPPPVNTFRPRATGVRTGGGPFAIPRPTFVPPTWIDEALPTSAPIATEEATAPTVTTAGPVDDGGTTVSFQGAYEAAAAAGAAISYDLETIRMNTMQEDSDNLAALLDDDGDEREDE